MGPPKNTSQSVKGSEKDIVLLGTWMISFPSPSYFLLVHHFSSGMKTAAVRTNTPATAETRTCSGMQDGVGTCRRHGGMYTGNGLPQH